MAPKKSQLESMEKLFAALADKTRLRLLNLMREEEVCVCFFTEVLDESQPKISRHLAYLRKAGLVESRRDGKWVHYSIAMPENEFAQNLINEALAWLDDQTQLSEEFEELISVCCAVDAPVTIARAPKPDALVKQESMPVQEEQEIETYLL